MKLSQLNKTIPLKVVVLLLFFPCCTPDTKEEKDEECATTEMPNRHIDVQPKLNASASILPEGRILKEAESLIFRGSIRKQYCGGAKGDPFSYNSTHDPRAIDMTYWTQGFFVGTIYGFELANLHDLLLINYELIAVFPDGLKFSFSFDASGHYWDSHSTTRSIFWDDNAFKHYILITTSQTDTWLPYIGN